MACGEYGFDTPFSSSSAQVPSRSLLSLLTTAWPFLGLVSLSATIMLLKLASRLLRLYVALLLLPFSDWNPISVAQGARRLLVAELLEFFIWVVTYLRQLIALIAPHEVYDPHIVTTDLHAHDHDRTSHSLTIHSHGSHGSPDSSSKTSQASQLPWSNHQDVDEDIPLPLQSRAASRSRRPSDASRPASADNGQFSIDEDVATRHRQLEQALETARNSGEVMARTVLQITREREELLHQSALLRSPDARVAELEDRNFNPQLPHSPLLSQSELPAPQPYGGLQLRLLSKPRASFFSSRETTCARCSSIPPRVMLISPTLDTTVAAKHDIASGSLFPETNAIGVFMSPIEDGDHLYPDRSF
ncbi:hypothetical protein BS47DRAFT_1485825 [Hydnum rufescens UP504]|uniref:Uncharacterized protein n=1 Tax=Hydnum rufescens UP504 TaxID=1448309 RepID=A0A9P6AW35_9AGAM|nr:hypothetical protein BS47DRAFT_1485825 [Hydnum rufescens UP504]